MSYILDAIKKSESERERSSEPEALSMQAGNAYRSQAKGAKTPWLLVIVLLLVALLIWWFWPSLSSVVFDTREKVNSEIGSGENQGSAAVLSVKENARSTPDSSLSAGSNAVTAEDSSSEASHSVASFYDANAELPPANEIKELWQLPADFQARIPDLTFSFHVYSATPEKRTIIINGRRMREGQMVTSKIKLRLITDTGVVLHAYDRFFHVDVVEKW